MNLILLIETRCCLDKLQDLGLNLGYRFCAGVDPVGRSGGLWAAWDDKYKLILLHRCCNSLIFKVVDERNIEWVLCLLYGHPNLWGRVASRIHFAV